MKSRVRLGARLVRCLAVAGVATAGFAWSSVSAVAAPQVGPRPPAGEGQWGPPGEGPMGPGSMGGPGGAEQEVVKRFDADGDGWLDAAERKAALEALKRENADRPRGPMRGPGGAGPGGRRGGPPGMEASEPGRPGPKVSLDSVKPVPATVDLYDSGTLRTIFMDFPEEGADWESALEAFYNTDVEVPATLTVDGVKYPQVGVQFRGASSFHMVPAGSKRSFNISMDARDSRQTLLGYKTLNLLNSHGDPSMMSTVLCSAMGRSLMPTPRANFVRVVVNGEYWGVFVNVEQFNGDFVKRNFGAASAGKAKASKDGEAAGKEGHYARWKVPGRPNGSSGLQYTGDDLAAYRMKYEIKSKDRPEDWAALVNLCKVLDSTPPEQLEAALAPILDIEGTLRFLALDIVVGNSDGYWTRASDYSLVRDPGGVFHLVPHDMNECFKMRMMGPGGPGGGRGRRGPDAQGPPGDGVAGGPPAQRGAPGGPSGIGQQGGGTDGTRLDPLVGMDDPVKPLRSKLLAVPALRARYLAHVRELARDWLDWKRLGALVEANRALIAEAVAQDTRKLTSLQSFNQATGPNGALRQFADKRRAYLLNDQPPKADAAKGGKPVSTENPK